MLQVNFDVANLHAHVARLKDAIDGGIRPAAQAAAQVFYDEVKLRAGRNARSGNLAASIYQKFIPGLSTDRVNARYHVSWRKGYQGKATGAYPIAFHGQLIEYGWIQRYASYVGSDGQWHTAIRPEMRAKPKPKRNASQAVKDAYYVLRKGGPIQHAPQSFLRASYEAKKAEASQVAVNAMQEHVARAFL